MLSVLDQQPHLAWRKLKTHGLVSPPEPRTIKEEA